MVRRSDCGIVAFITCCFAMEAAGAADWPQFLGGQRNGVSDESGLISAWPESGPTIVWRTPLGVSMSGVSISGNRVFTMFQNETNQFVVALNAETGSEVWRSPVAPKYENSMGHGPRATPTVVDGIAYGYSGEGILAALNAADGKLLWSVDVPTSLGGQPSEYGMSCSPLHVGESIVVHAGTPAAAVAAYDRTTGKQIWTAGRGPAGYSSPVAVHLGGRRQVVALTGTGLLGLDPADGKVLWSFEFPTDFNCNTASPVQLDEQTLLISAGEDHGSAILRIAGATDGFTVSEIWKSYGRDSQLRAEWQTPVVVAGYLYGLDNVGGAGPVTHLTCLRLSDRKTMWRKDRFGKSNLIAADGKLFVTTMNGELLIVSADPEKYRELGRAMVMEATRQAPALSDGQLFVSDHREVLCIDARAAGTGPAGN